MPDRATATRGEYWVEAPYEDEQMEQTEQYVDETINEFGDSGVQTELRVLETKYQKADDSGSYMIVLDSARQLLAYLDESVDKGSFPTKYAALMTKYSRLIGVCDDYLQSHSGYRFTSTGRGRVKTITRMITDAQHEVLLLQTMGAEAAASETAKTWREIMFGGERAARAEAARGEEGRPDYSAYRSDVTSIMSSESFMQMCGGELDDNERRIYELLANIGKSRDPNFAANSGYLDQILEAIGTNPAKSVLQLLKNQCEQRKMESDTGGAAQQAVALATQFAREATARTAMRDKLMSELKPDQVPEGFAGSGEHSRVAFRMSANDEETSRARLANEIAYYSGKGDTGSYDMIKSGVADELRALLRFRLVDMSEGELMENYSVLSRLEMSAMHISDIAKQTNEQGKSIKSEILSELGMTDRMANCIVQIIGCYQFLGRGLWSMRALDLGWVPAIDELTEADKKHIAEFADENRVVDPEKFRAYIKKEILDKYRRNLDYLKNYYKDLIPSLMANA